MLILNKQKAVARIIALAAAKTTGCNDDSGEPALTADRPRVASYEAAVAVAGRVSQPSHERPRKPRSPASDAAPA